MKPIAFALFAVALAVLLPAEARPDDDPVQIFRPPAGTVYFVLDLRDVDMPGGRQYQAVEPTIGATFAGPAHTRIAIQASRKQVVEPIWQGVETRLRIGIGRQF